MPALDLALGHWVIRRAAGDRLGARCIEKQANPCLASFILRVFIQFTILLLARSMQSRSRQHAIKPQWKPSPGTCALCFV